MRRRCCCGSCLIHEDTFSEANTTTINKTTVGTGGNIQWRAVRTKVATGDDDWEILDGQLISHGTGSVYWTLDNNSGFPSMPFIHWFGFDLNVKTAGVIKVGTLDTDGTMNDFLPYFELDYSNNKIRLIDPTLAVTTVADCDYTFSLDTVFNIAVIAGMIDSPNTAGIGGGADGRWNGTGSIPSLVINDVLVLSSHYYGTSVISWNSGFFGGVDPGCLRTGIKTEVSGDIEIDNVKFGSGDRDIPGDMEHLENLDPCKTTGVSCQWPPVIETPESITVVIADEDNAGIAPFEYTDFTQLNGTYELYRVTPSTAAHGTNVRGCVYATDWITGIHYHRTAPTETVEIKIIFKSTSTGRFMISVDWQNETGAPPDFGSLNGGPYRLNLSDFDPCTMQDTLVLESDEANAFGSYEHSPGATATLTHP